MTKILSLLSAISENMTDAGVKVGIIVGKIETYERLIAKQQSAVNNTYSILDLIVEAEERIIRSKNIILFNVP